MDGKGRFIYHYRGHWVEGPRGVRADSPGLWLRFLEISPPDYGLAMFVTVNDEQLGSPTCYTVAKRIIDDFVGPPFIDWEKRTLQKSLREPEKHERLPPAS
jgi:hypothetical protein